MTLSRTRGIVAGMALMLLMGVGCASTRVNFTGPPGSVITIDGTPHHIPTQVEMGRPVGTGGSQRHDVSLVSTVQSKELRAKGYIDLFGYTESDLDKMAVNTCNLDEAQLARLFEGSTVIFRGQSASRQPLYDLTLRRE